MCCYILEINPLLVTFFGSILSHSVGCLFILLMVSFVAQKLSFDVVPLVGVWHLFLVLSVSCPKIIAKADVKELPRHVFF